MRRVKGSITVTETYEKTTQALATSRDEAELKEGLAIKRRNMRRKNHRRSLYQTGRQRKTVPESDEDEEPETNFQEQDLTDRTEAALETFFESA